MIDHKFHEELEYKGEYGGRFTCQQCVHFGSYGDYKQCDKQGVEVHWSNNICRGFEAKIKNPSSPEFNFDDYLEFLGSDYYRPWSVDSDIVVGSARLGEAYADGGKLARQSEEYIKYLEETEQLDNLNNYKPYTYMYKSYDKHYCKARFKDVYVSYNGNAFHIDYIRFRELNTVEDGVIKFKVRTWKDKPKQRKYNKETNGEYIII